MLHALWNWMGFRATPPEPIVIGTMIRALTVPDIWTALPRLPDSLRAAIHEAIPGLADAQLDTWLNDRPHLIEHMTKAWIWAHVDAQLELALAGYRSVGPGLLFFDGRADTPHTSGYRSSGDLQEAFGSYTLSLARDLRAYDPTRAFGVFVIWAEPDVPADQRLYWLCDLHDRS